MPAQITVQLPQIGVAPSRDDPANLDDNTEEMFSKIGPLQLAIDQFSGQANALALDVNSSAQAAEQAAAAAAQAAQSAGAVTWVSGATYALNASVISPSDNFTYRKRTPSSVSNTDPANDPTNWKNITVVPPAAGNLVDSGSSGTPIAWNAGAIEVPTLTLVGNRTLAAPTNLKAGPYVMHVKQDATGGRSLAFDAAFVFPDDVPPDIDVRPNRRTVFSFISDGVNLYGSYMPGYSK
ncbi:hypothetical protein [Massilia sp. DD77]|uniref:hypothetical protein n=1 Tax=Massilia sp. DD77 TaxID=3109349 RepID=UPI002FFDFDE2